MRSHGRIARAGIWDTFDVVVDSLDPVSEGQAFDCGCVWKWLCVEVAESVSKVAFLAMTSTQVKVRLAYG
jgi:hypothetical protein